MSFLLDTHTLLWWITADHRLSARAKTTIDDGHNARYVSAVSAFEISNKVRIGKLDFAIEFSENFEDIISAGNFKRLDVSLPHALLAGKLPGPHKDPFDRLLAAQCRVERLSLITIDPAFKDFDLDIIW